MTIFFSRSFASTMSTTATVRPLKALARVAALGRYDRVGEHRNVRAALRQFGCRVTLIRDVFRHRTTAVGAVGIGHPFGRIEVHRQAHVAAAAAGAALRVAAAFRPLAFEEDLAALALDLVLIVAHAPSSGERSAGRR